MRKIAGFAVLGLYLLGIGLSLTAGAQTTATRETQCSPATEWNAMCVSWNPVTTYEGGAPLPAGVAVTYKVEQRIGTTGNWVQAAEVSTPRALISNLSPGVYFFRVFSVAQAITGNASNIAQRTLQNPQPGAPVITIAVVISPQGEPTVINLSAFDDGRVTCDVVPS
jgi:hypothetical protein